MRRRLIRWLAVLAAAGAFAPAQAQPGAKPVVGFLQGVSDPDLVAAFGTGLKKMGFVVGANLVLDYGAAPNQGQDRRAQAEEFVRRRVAVIFAAGSSNAVLAKKVTATVPIVFVMGGDPGKLGLVSNLARPEANVTGITRLGHSLASKQLELLHQVTPNATVVTVLVNPSNPNTEMDAVDLQAAARSIGKSLDVVNAQNSAELDSVLADLRKKRGRPLLVGNDPLFLNQRDKVVAAAARNAMPAIYSFKQFVEAGGLMSYAADQADSYREAGVYVGRILKGARPSDLPVQQATKVELLINMKTANALGLKIPQSVLQRVDRTIQ